MGFAVEVFFFVAGTAVSSPGISAPPDVVVGEADGYVDLPVSLSGPGTSPVSVSYTATPRLEPRPLNDRPASRALRGSGRRSASRPTVVHPRQEASS